MTKELDLENMSLEELLLDHAQKKYYLVNYAIKWQNELRKKEDSPKTPYELMEKSLRDVISGAVAIKDIVKQSTAKQSETHEKTK